MLDSEWPGVDAQIVSAAVDAALADAEVNDVGFAVIGRGDDGWAETPVGQTVDRSWKEGWNDYLVAMVTHDRRGVITAGLASDMAERARSPEDCLITHLHDLARNHGLTHMDGFDFLTMHLTPIRFG